MLMMENDFVAGSAHIDNLDEQADGLPIVLQSKDRKLNRIMSNSFGFGGTNAVLSWSVIAANWRYLKASGTYSYAFL